MKGVGGVGHDPGVDTGRHRDPEIREEVRDIAAIDPGPQIGVVSIPIGECLEGGGMELQLLDLLRGEGRGQWLHVIALPLSL